MEDIVPLGSSIGPTGYDYMEDWASVTQLGRDDSDIATYEFFNIWPSVLGDIALDAAGTDAVHGSVPSLESYYTMCYPMQSAPDGLGGTINSVPPAFLLDPESITYTDIDNKSSSDVFVAPNPWRASVMEDYHGATTAQGYFIRFYNLKNKDYVLVFDVAGNLVFESEATSDGSFDWNLVSRTRNQVSTGIYYWKVGDQSGKLAVIR